MIHEADVIYCMTHAHRKAPDSNGSGSAAEKTLPLDPHEDIADPDRVRRSGLSTVCPIDPPLAY